MKRLLSAQDEYEDSQNNSIDIINRRYDTKRTNAKNNPRIVPINPNKSEKVSISLRETIDLNKSK